jgi:predicted DNA binding CopG/RHH family protein
MNDGIKRKPLPDFASDEDAEDFVDHADLSDYDLSDFKTMRFHFAPPEQTVTIRLPAPLLAALKAKADSTGLSYDRLVEQALSAALQD